MAYEFILVDRAVGGVGIITLNRPRVLNAMNSGLNAELHDALVGFERDDSILSVVITGTGERAFSAGGDIHEMASMTPEEMEARQRGRPEYTWYIANFPKPTIGAINGLAFGGAAILASALDIRVGCERSSFKFLGAMYGRMNSTWTLPHIVGLPRAKELLFTAREVKADEALQIGLLNCIVPAAEVVDAAIAMGRQIGTNAPSMVQAAKVLLNDNIGRDYRAMYDGERDMLDRNKPSPVAEGFKPFLDRKPLKTG